MEFMHVAGLLVLICFGFSILALSLPSHWREVTGDGRSSRPRVGMMRVAGYSALAASFSMAILVDGASFGTILWVMLLTVGASIVAAILTVRPRSLRYLAIIFKHLEWAFGRRG